MAAAAAAAALTGKNFDETEPMRKAGQSVKQNPNADAAREGRQDLRVKDEHLYDELRVESDATDAAIERAESKFAEQLNMCCITLDIIKDFRAQSQPRY